MVRRDIAAMGKHNINPSFFKNLESKDSFSQAMNITKNTQLHHMKDRQSKDQNSVSTRRPEGSSSLKSNNFKVTYKAENFVSITTKFAFGDCLGQGSFAKVYSAFDKESGQTVAVKVLDKSKLMQGRRRQMAQMEIDVMRDLMVARKAKTDGENLCEILAVHEDKKRVSTPSEGKILTELRFTW